MLLTNLIDKLRLNGKRNKLPERRKVETIKFEAFGHKWHASMGHYKNGDPAEIFIDTAKSGELLRSMCKDTAIVASLALQYGCPYSTLRDSLTRNSPLSQAMDLLEKKQ